MIALKLDIDTRRGMRDGLPPLLDLFKREGVLASIYPAFGPDESGKAIKRIWTKKGFLKKMARTNPAKLYGVKTMLYGTLLPAPPVASAFPELLKRVEAEGHELGVHGYSHIQWQDNLDSLPEEAILKELSSARAAFEKAVGRPPEAFAAPAWALNEKALRCLESQPWTYYSNTRGRDPVRPKIGAVISNRPEFPTTLPTLDEVLAWDHMTPDRALAELANAPEKGRLNVYTFHTEVEGLAYFNFFESLLSAWKKRGFKFVRLIDEAHKLTTSTLPQKEVQGITLPGRGGLVAGLAA